MEFEREQKVLNKEHKKFNEIKEHRKKQDVLAFQSILK